MRNSHKNRIETSSSRFYSVCNAKASGLFLDEGLLERERRKGGSRVDLHGERTRLLSDLYDSPWFIRSWVFFLHRFTNLKRANRSIVIDGSMFWIVKTIRYRLWMFLQVFVLVTWFFSKISRMEKVKILWIMNIYLFIWYNRA